MSTGQYPLLINQPLSHSVILPPPLCPLENTNKSSAKFAKRNNTPQFSSVVWAKPESTMSNFRKPSSSSRSLNVSPKSSPSPCVSLPRSLDLPPLPVFLTSSPPVKIVHRTSRVFIVFGDHIVPLLSFLLLLAGHHYSHLTG